MSSPGLGGAGRSRRRGTQANSDLVGGSFCFSKQEVTAAEIAQLRKKARLSGVKEGLTFLSSLLDSFSQGQANTAFYNQLRLLADRGALPGGYDDLKALHHGQLENLISQEIIKLSDKIQKINVALGVIEPDTLAALLADLGNENPRCASNKAPRVKKNTTSHTPPKKK